MQAKGLKLGDAVVLDNLLPHKVASVRDVIEAAGRVSPTIHLIRTPSCRGSEISQTLLAKLTIWASPNFRGRI